VNELVTKEGKNNNRKPDTFGSRGGGKIGEIRGGGEKGKHVISHENLDGKEHPEGDAQDLPSGLGEKSRKAKKDDVSNSNPSCALGGGKGKANRLQKKAPQDRITSDSTDSTLNLRRRKEEVRERVRGKKLTRGATLGREKRKGEDKGRGEKPESPTLLNTGPVLVVEVEGGRENSGGCTREGVRSFLPSVG